MLLARRLLPATRTAAWLQRRPPVVTTVQRSFAKKKKKGKGSKAAEAAANYTKAATAAMAKDLPPAEPAADTGARASTDGNGGTPRVTM